MRISTRVGLAVTCVCALLLQGTQQTVAAGSTVFSPWVSQDIGAVGQAGSAFSSGGVFTVRGSGADIWGTADSFQSVLQPVSGDTQIVVARVTSLQNTNTYAKAGIMLRASTAAGAAHVILDLRPNGSIEFMSRSQSGGATTWHAGSAQNAPVWLKLMRSGASIAASVSPNGTTWIEVGSTNVSLGGSPLAGLVVTSHDTSLLSTATFDNVVVANLPAPWMNQDVGSVGQAGSASLNNGVLTVRGAGSDIWGSADSFHAVLRPITGDTQIITRVTGLQNTNAFAKAGLMLRSSPAANSAHVILGMNPNGSIEFMSRSQAGGSTSWHAGSSQNTPAWLKLARTGSVVTGYVSANGTSWTKVGTTTASLGATAFAGLAVTSHDSSQLNTASFDNLSVGVPPVIIPPPGVPASLTPAIGQQEQSTSTGLSWGATGATSYDLNFGTTNPPSQAATGLTAGVFAPAGLQEATTYYWQVVARNAGGVTAGPIAWFKTAEPPPPPPPPPPPSPDPGNGGGGGGEGSAGGGGGSGVPGDYSAITDRSSYAKPALPALGPAGHQFSDPTFGSRMLRVTDTQTRPGLVNRSFRVPSNAHLAAWNATSSAFFVVSNDGTVIPYTFDAATMTASRVHGGGPGGNDNGGLTLSFYVEPQFSLVNPNLIYGVASGGNNRTIAEYNFATGAYTTIVNLDAIVGGLANTYVGGVMTGGLPSEKLITFFGGASQDQHYYALWAPVDGIAGGKLLNTVASTINGVPTATPLNFRLHAVQIDRSGRYVFLYPTSVDLAPPRRAAQVYIWDTTLDIMTPITTAMLAGGHDAAGFGVWINQDCCTSSTWDAAQWQFRSLGTPGVTTDLISPVLPIKEVYLSDHLSWNNAQPDRLVPVISSTYRFGNNTAPWRAWDDEIIGVDTASVGRVWRFAHHRSSVGSDANPAAPYFWYEPIANVSPDGRWVIFTSNWEKTLGTDSSEGTARQDVFLVELKPQ